MTAIRMNEEADESFDDHSLSSTSSNNVIVNSANSSRRNPNNSNNHNNNRNNNEDNEDNEADVNMTNRKKFLYGSVFVTALTCIAIRYWMKYRAARRGRKIYDRLKSASLTALLLEARRGGVKKVLLGATHCSFQLFSDSRESSSFLHLVKFVPSHETSCFNLIVKALLDGGCTDVSVSSEKSRDKSTPFFAALPFVYLGLLYKMMKNLQSNADDALKDKKTSKYTIRSGVKFTDIAGIDNAKLELEEVVECLKNPTKYNKVGAQLPRGVLLYGPSGTGKTLLARAVAGEAKAAFLHCSASDFVEMLVGRGASRIRDLFDKARKAARKPQNKKSWTKIFKRAVDDTTQRHDVNSSNQQEQQIPAAVIFIDEIDALAKARGGINSNDEREQTLNQLLTEMDGFESRSSEEDGNNPVRIIVLAATNRIETLDKALLRPGRFDRHVYVGIPDERGREAILNIHVKKVTMCASVNLRAIAEESNGFSGADLSNVVNEAALLAVRSGADVARQIHFLEATQRVRAMKESMTTLQRKTIMDIPNI